MSTETTATDYATIIDQETQAFIKRTEAAYPDNAVSLSIEEQRALYDAMCREFHAGFPDGVNSRDLHIGADEVGTVAVRQYTKDKQDDGLTPVQIVYLHGGGFIVGGLESHDDVCAEICDRTGYSLTSVDYRLAPEHKHPAALNDVMIVIDHLWNSYQQAILICGDSAGANLGAAACHAYRGKGEKTSATPTVCGQVLVYPGLGGDTSTGSYITHANAPLLGTNDVDFYAEKRSASSNDIYDPLFSPLCDSDFSNLPPTIVISAECDPLSDDGMHYCSHIERAGGKAHWINEKGLVHGYIRARHSVRRAAESFDRITQSISSLASGYWPYYY